MKECRQRPTPRQRMALFINIELSESTSKVTTNIAAHQLPKQPAYTDMYRLVSFTENHSRFHTTY